MKKLSVLLIGLAALLVATLPLMAQTPYAAPGHARNFVVVQDATHQNSPTGILPSQYRAAYGFNRIPNAGAGVTIALVDAYKDPNIVSDVAFYANYFHLSPCNFTVVVLGTIEGQGWDLEESLDVQQACALAPQANIVLVEAASSSYTDLLNAVAVASSAPYNASVVSMSWGGSDSPGESSYDVYFCNIVNGLGQPVTNVAATGDGGHGTIYPSTSPCVVAAGGTSLVLSTATPLANPLELDYGHETAWNGSGGGISCVGCETEPSWQVTACAPYSPGGYRCVPDISSDANPGTGVPVYDTFSYGGWVQVGGTSVATPDWGSFFTLVNSQRVINLGTTHTLSMADPDLYTLYSNSSDYANDFHDITSGTNGSCGLDCDTEVGYDLVTGIGTYQANNLFPAMVAMPN
ncbi:MAG: S53 family peptidase [Candidatus Korobacteraceae bacterium]|jgi:subtilase family serine protease